MTFHRKIGGIHWFALGRVRISVCLTRPKPSVDAKLEMLRRAMARPGVSEAKPRPKSYTPASKAVRVKPLGYPRPKELPRTTVFSWPPETKQ